MLDCSAIHLKLIRVLCGSHTSVKGKKAEVGEQGLQPVTDAKSEMTAEENETGGRRKSSVQMGKALHQRS